MEWQCYILVREEAYYNMTERVRKESAIDFSSPWSSLSYLTQVYLFLSLTQCGMPESVLRERR